MGRCLVVARNLTRIFSSSSRLEDVHALGPLDLELVEGKFFAVVGPSGCGKSTLLEVIGGLQEPTHGEVRFNGTAVKGRVPEGVGIVFQEDASFPWHDARAIDRRLVGQSSSSRT